MKINFGILGNSIHVFCIKIFVCEERFIDGKHVNIFLTPRCLWFGRRVYAFIHVGQNTVRVRKNVVLAREISSLCSRNFQFLPHKNTFYDNLFSNIRKKKFFSIFAESAYSSSDVFFMFVPFSIGLLKFSLSV